MSISRCRTSRETRGKGKIAFVVGGHDMYNARSLELLTGSRAILSHSLLMGEGSLEMGGQ